MDEWISDQIAGSDGFGASGESWPALVTIEILWLCLLFRLIGWGM